MDVVQKLQFLTREARYEVTDIDVQRQAYLKHKHHSTFGTKPDEENMPVFYASTGGGKKIALLKILLASACENNCNYCACRSGRDFMRFNFSPDELAKAFMNLYNSGVVKGLFLSSGITGGGICTQDRLLATAEILRKKMRYQGYIHLKIMPGAEWEQIYFGMQLADRVSINLEAPNQDCLRMLAPKKIYIEELLQRVQWINEIQHNYDPNRGWHGKWPSSTTQFVVGAVHDTDRLLLNSSAYLHKTLNLKRIYYSKFNPVIDTPLEGHPAANPKRIQRLYQADFLLRDYNYQLEDFIFNNEHNLSLDIDPKLSWAKTHLSQTPVEINAADRSALLRIPGIGPKGVSKILLERNKSRIKYLGDLKRLGIRVERSLPFILLDGKRPDHQLTLW